jgi:superfamily II DNA or RNA helicase
LINVNCAFQWVIYSIFREGSEAINALRGGSEAINALRGGSKAINALRGDGCDEKIDTNCPTFLYHHILAMTDNMDLWYEYELFSCEDIRKKGYAVYPWNEIPPNMLLDANLVLDLEVIRKNDAILKKGGKVEDVRYKDTGVDALMIDGDGKFVFVQCKCGYAKNGVGIHDLNGFFINLVTNPHGKGLIYYTDKLSGVVENLLARAKIASIVDVKGVLLNYNPTPIALPAPIVEQPIVVAKPKKGAKKAIVELPQPIVAPIVTQPIYKLYDYQQKAVSDLTKHFLTNRNAILSYPAGVGKTIISYDLSKNYKYVFIISPYRSHAEQNFKRFIEYSGNNENIGHILISSDGNRDAPSILQSIANKQRCVMSSTFDSVDVVNAVIKNIVGSYIVIVDEFHNLSKAQVGVFSYDYEDVDDYVEPTNEMHTLITTATKILFVSATPCVYEMEGIEGEDFNKKLFGENVATMTFSEAIAKKYITDYKIFVPSIGENYDELNKCIKNEIGLDVVGNEIYAKTIFLMKGFRYNGNKKCIMYCRSVEEIKLFQKSFKEMDEFYALNLKFYTVTAETKNRSAILQEFSNDTGYSLIFSIRTLDECIDVDCDSIYISYASHAIVKNVQRVFRCTRINKNNPNKVGFIYVYCDEYNELLQVFSSLRECDTNFMQKVNVMNAKLGTREICESENVKKNKKIVIDEYVVEVKEYTFDGAMNKLKQYLHVKKQGLIQELQQFDSVKLMLWYYHQRRKYEANEMPMSNKPKFEQLVREYGKLLNSRINNWTMMLQKVDTYMSATGERPIMGTGNTDIEEMAKWLHGQITWNNKNQQVIKDDRKRELWTIFVEKHKSNFESPIEVWKTKLQFVDDFIRTTGKKPTETTNPTSARWIASQLTNIDEIMQDNVKRELWVNLTTKYEEQFLTREEKWLVDFALVEKYIIEQKTYPLPSNKNDALSRLGRWYGEQISNYKHKKNILKDDTYYKKFEGLLDKYGLNPTNENNFNLFIRPNANEKWHQNLKYMDEFIQKNGIRPSGKSHRAIEKWIGDQISDYNTKTNYMTNNDICKIWEQMVKKYPDILISESDKWYVNFTRVENYIIETSKLPSAKSKIDSVMKLGRWFAMQLQYVDERLHMLRDDDKFEKMIALQTKYPLLFRNYKEVWLEKFEHAVEYLKKTNKRPPTDSTDEDIQILRQWFYTQVSNYNIINNALKDGELYAIWEALVEKYPRLFESNHATMLKRREETNR